ncbi:hypothetical protein GALMADRAFT_247111 [Galerina marginata CBS 339.88]|uniref:Uncharacterized protein n=1 Tax=Galerina marginata (strain CBS 339.88) TaxID=685588 RepID=A0A067T0V7_GALM3|nr:hypothetical protein GALMADRAFT_247111 [Galerina marginata CBS 339.88]
MVLFFSPFFHDFGPMSYFIPFCFAFLTNSSLSVISFVDLPLRSLLLTYTRFHREVSLPGSVLQAEARGRSQTVASFFWAVPVRWLPAEVGVGW